MAKAPKKILTTPKGVLQFPSLRTPNTKFTPEGNFEAPLILRQDCPDTQAFLAKLEPFYKQAEAFAQEQFKALPVGSRKKLGEVKMNPLYTEVYDKDTEEPTGEIKFNFKMKASGVRQDGTKWTAKLPVFDAKGKKLDPVPDAWGGTVAKVSFEVKKDFKTGQFGYFIPGTGAGGLTLALEAVQIIELSSGGARDAGGYGFGEEDGYEGSDETDESGWSGSDDAEASAGDNGDF
ncbi:hypothetical protein [Asaia prunellae]|uniref:hypothetical protein n=1 Tax=Asaia prunellae TaxID=610245 RepID=UPI00046EC489|nr:hypothetical protein [Asaia prunellae]